MRRSASCTVAIAARTEAPLRRRAWVRVALTMRTVAAASSGLVRVSASTIASSSSADW